jgi:putative phosphoesterase
MKILLIADTHGYLHPAILALARAADSIVHAGDIGSPEVLQQLDASGTPWTAVLGNNDTPARWPDGSRDGLADIGELRIGAARLVVEHGHRANPARQRHDVLRRRHAGADLVVYGHSHRLVIDREQTPWVVNPGAAGRSRTFGGPSCVLLDASGSEWQLRPYRFSLSNWKV